MPREVRPGPSRRGFPVPAEMKAGLIGIPPETTTGPQYAELEREKNKYQGKTESEHKLTESVGEIWYHGSQWPRRAIKNDTFDDVQCPVFFTKDKNVAKEYSLHDIGAGGARNNRTGEKKSPTVYTVEVRPTKVFDLRKKECQQVYEIIRQENPDKEMRLPRFDSEGFIMSKTRLPSFGPARTILNLIKNHGYDSSLFDEGTQGISLAFNDVRGKTKIIDVENVGMHENQNLKESTDNIYFHGSPYTGIENNFDNVKAPIYFTKHKSTAYQYAAGSIIGLAQQNLGNYKKSPTLYTVEVNAHKILDLRKPECQRDYDEVRKNNPDRELKSRKVPEGSFISGKSGLPFNGTEIIYMRLLAQQPYGYDAVILDEPNSETSLALFSPKGKTKILNADSVGKQSEGKSIKHLDDLPESRFLPMLKALAEGKLEITEKLDGSARMTFGIENGKIWTQSKSGSRRYESKAYPNRPQFKALRMAHEALESNSQGVIGAWPSGVSEMVSEVLYTKVPNTIEYGPNAIVVHRVNWLEGTCGQNKICVEDIKRVMVGEWRLDYRPDVKFDLAPFRVLHANVGILPLSFIQSETRKQILKAMQEMTSAYGTKKGLIEGVVLRDTRTGDMTKVVDRQLFTRLNQFFWRFRESLERGTMIEGKWQTGVMAAFRKRLAEDILQATGLRNPKLIEVVKKNKKSTLDETLLAMIPNKKFPLLDFDNTVSEGITQLNRLMIDWRLHLAMQPSLVLVSEDGSYSRTVSMHELVIERTEAAFADAVEYFESMSRIGTNIKENPARLVMVAKVVMGPNVVEKLEKLFEAEVHPGDWPDTKQHHAPEKMGVKIPSNTQKPEKPAEMKSKIDAVLKSHIELLKKRGIQTHGEHVGQGSFGVAFDANFKGKNVVLKITSDKSEANASNHIVGKKLKHIVHIYDVFKFKDTIYYGVLQEKLQKLHESEKDNFNTLVFIMQKAKVGPELIKGDIDAALDKVEKTFADKPNTIKFFAQAVVSFDFDKIIEELASNGIQFIDYHGGNLMKRGEDFVLIDLGMSRVPNTNIPILETIMRLLTEKAAARVGVTLGRFQPFHKGHAAIIRDLCKKYTRVIVLVAGNKRDKKNPFSYELRLEMMKNSLPDVFSKIEVHKAEFEGKSSGYIPGILSDISINKKSSIQGDTAFEILVGDDRVQEIQKQMDHARQSKTQGTQLYFDPDMVIVKALPGVKNDDEAGRVSGTSLRAAVLKGDKESAKKLVDPHLVSNPADFESLYVRMEKELKGGTATVESVVKRIVEGLAQIGGEVAIQKVLKDNAKLLKHKNIDVRSLRKLGEGDNGIVYSIGNNKALKVTSDIEQDAETCMHLMNKHQENVVHIFDVFKFPNAPMAGIIEEELKPLSKDEITEFDDMRKTVLALFGQSDKEQGEFTKAMELGDFDKFRKKLEIFLAKEIRLNLQYPAGSQVNPNKEQRLKDTLSKGMTRYSNVLVKYNVPNIMKDLKKMGIKFSDYHGTNIMKRGNKYVIADLGGSASASIKIPVLEMVNVVVSDIVNELGIFTGNSDTTVGARAGSSQWSKGRQLDASSGSLDGQWQDQLKGFPKLR